MLEKCNMCVAVSLALFIPFRDGKHRTRLNGRSLMGALPPNPRVSFQQGKESECIFPEDI